MIIIFMMSFHFLFEARQNQVLRCIFPKKYTNFRVLQGAGAGHFFQCGSGSPQKRADPALQPCSLGFILE